MKTTKPITSEGTQSMRSLPIGEYFKRSSICQIIWVRGPYDRSERGYECHKADDVNEGRYFEGSTDVWVGFTY